MRIETFLNRMGKRHRGRIPHVAFTADWRSLRWELDRLLRSPMARSNGLVTWAAEALEILEGLETGALQYRALNRLSRPFSDIGGDGRANAGGRVGRVILLAHDLFVMGKNAGAGQAPLECSEKGGPAGCRQCGECCIGPAAGPISTSVVDIRRWEDLGRDDLLYYTQPGPEGRAGRARQLRFEACPFLRFASPHRGVCIVHPAKPAICREYVCAKSGPHPSSNPWNGCG